MINLLTKKCNNKIAIIYLIIASLLWSLGGVLIKLIQLNPIAITGIRSTISAALIWFLLKKPKFNWSKAQILGGISYACMMFFFVAANKMTTAANAILLQYTAPIYVAIFGFVFLKERTSRLDWITTIFVLSGMALFFMDDIELQNMLGNLLAIASGISFAAMVIVLRKQKNDSPLESILIGNIFAAVIALPFMFQSLPSTSDFRTLIILGIFQLGLPYIFYAIAIKHVSAMESILIPVIEPIANPIWVFLAVGEFPSKWAFVGGTIVLLAVTIRCIIVARNPQEQEVGLS